MTRKRPREPSRGLVCGERLGLAEGVGEELGGIVASNLCCAVAVAVDDGSKRGADKN